MDFVLEKIINKIVSLYNRFFDRTVYPLDDTIVKCFKERDEEKILYRLYKKERINVAFFCMAMPLFRYESIFKLMKEDTLFNPMIFVAPRNGDVRNRLRESRAIEKYCKQNNFRCVTLKNRILNIGRDISKYDIDIAFYTQPYYGICCKEYYYDKMNNSLLCYTPYGYLISYTKHNFVSVLNLIAWKNYMPTKVSMNVALTFNSNYKNLYFVGYPGYDSYCACKEFQWKCKDKIRIIWAPHHSIRTDGWLHLACFLDVYEDMVMLAKKYEQQIQILFKPHPHLYTALCSIWGRKKTIEYYNLWKSMPNTDMCEEDAYPIFKTSDALIHDCASFLLDYMYTQKPCLYIALSGKLNVETAEDGRSAYEAHYHAFQKKDIELFIVNVLIKGKDDMRDLRRDVFQKHIATDNGKTASINVVYDIKRSLKKA